MSITGCTGFISSTVQFPGLASDARGEVHLGAMPHVTSIEVMCNDSRIKAQPRKFAVNEHEAVSCSQELAAKDTDAVQLRVPFWSASGAASGAGGSAAAGGGGDAVVGPGEPAPNGAGGAVAGAVSPAEARLVRCTSAHAVIEDCTSKLRATPDGFIEATGLAEGNYSLSLYRPSPTVSYTQTAELQVMSTGLMSRTVDLESLLDGPTDLVPRAKAPALSIAEAAFDPEGGVLRVRVAGGIPSS